MLYAVGEPEDERTHAVPRGDGANGGDGIVAKSGAKSWVRRCRARRPGATPRRRGTRSVNGSAHIGPDDHRARWGKATELAEFVGDELGAPNGWVLGEDAKTRGTRAFAYVLRDRIVGAVFAEPLRRAYRTVPDDGGETGVEPRVGGDDGPTNDGSRPVTHYGGKILRRRRVPTRAVMGIRAGRCSRTGGPASRRVCFVSRGALVPGYACDAREVADAADGGWPRARGGDVRARGRDVPGVLRRAETC